MSSQQSAFEMDGERFRRLGYSLVDSLVDLLDAESTDPVLPVVLGSEVRKRFSGSAPRQGQSVEAILAEAVELVGSLSRKNGHPRFFGYVCASADPVGILADFLASTVNQNVTAWRSSPGGVEMERQVVRWLDEGLGFDGKGHGMLLSGGSAANAHGISCAKTRALVSGRSLEELTIYFSSEAHLSLRQAALAIGFDRSRIRTLPVDDNYRLDLAALEQTLIQDLESGLVPACVAASLGTANTGACRPLGGSGCDLPAA